MCNSTHSGPWRGLDVVERRQLGDALAERELQLTLQREAIFEVVLGCPGHVCAEHILALAGEAHPGLRMNKTTVYRTLDLFAELGLVSEHKCGDGPAQYEPALHGAHCHLLCQKCGTLENLDGDVAAEIQNVLATRHGFLVRLQSYPILGLCKACRN